MTSPLLVVGVDDDATSQCALEWALAIAERHRARLEAVHAWRWHHPAIDLVVPDLAASVAAAARQSVEVQLEKAQANRPARAAAVEVVPRTPEGDPAAALLAASAEADLLVLGRCGEGSRLRRLVEPDLGHVASHCLRHASVPVAIVPPAAAPAAPARVVVGVDGSTSSATALRWAVSEARLTGAPVVAVHAWQLTTVPAPASARAGGPTPPLTEWETVARDALDATVEQALGGDGAAGVERVLLHRAAAGGLLDLVRTDDLLVLGQRGRGGFERLLLGSVSRQCAEHAPCPVVIVPEQVRTQPRPPAPVRA